MLKKIICTCFLVFAAFSYAMSKEVTYQADDSVFPNPERGYLYSGNPTGDFPQPPLEEKAIKDLRTQGISTMSKYYHLIQYRKSPIPEEYFKMIDSDCQLLRKYGLKMIIRFTYNWLGGGPDASLKQILEHLEQLKPCIRKNIDVIAAWEVGFIGNWGEMHSSTNHLVDNWGLIYTPDTWKIIKKELDILPLERSVAIRYPRCKLLIYPEPLNDYQGFSGSVQSRIGHYNDSAFWSESDTTYSDVKEIMQAEKNYLNQDNQFVLQTGETGGDADIELILNKDWIMGQLEKMHWSCVDYELVSKSNKKYDELMKPGGIHEQIGKRLGYRFRLLKSVLPEKVRQGAAFRADIYLTNDGVAAPFNNRLVEIVIRQKPRFDLYKTREEYKLRVDVDPRRWLPGKEVHITAYGGVPLFLPIGAYDIFLNLPDPMPSLYERPEYSIRLANTGVWEELTGYNKLLGTVEISPDAEGRVYIGDDFFWPYIFQPKRTKSESDKYPFQLPSLTYSKGE
jgi:hypothetical protein